MKTALTTAFLFVVSILFAAQTKSVKVMTEQDGTGTLLLPSGERFATTLYHLQVLGHLKTKTKLPYYILSGVVCVECDANKAIYVYSPSDGKMDDEVLRKSFMYPGRELDYIDGRIIFRGKMFFGNCAPGYSNSIVSFEQFVAADKKWHSRVLTADLKSDNLQIQIVDSHPPSIGEALAAVKHGECIEVPGIKRFSEP